MPIVTVATYSGRTQTEKDRLAETITDDIVRIWKVKKKDVIVVFQEAPMGTGMPQAFVYSSISYP
jgi:4-oxalocrotonate tautomerase